MSEELEWTGERFLPEVEGDVLLEHMHRYYLALKLAKGKHVLDIACGEGYGSNLLSGEADRVIGVDLSEDAIDHAQNKYQKENLSFIQGDCTAIPLQTDSVDLVVSFETIEHHDRHRAFLDEIRRVLKPDGFLIISSPDKMEYTDLTGHQNQFHIKELYFSEFESLISQTFTHHTMLGQRIKFGSWITPLNPGATAGFNTYKVDHNGYAHEESTIYNPMYFLCVAGETELPQTFFSLYEHPVEKCDLVQRATEAFSRKSKAHKDLTERFLSLSNDHALLEEKAKHTAKELKYRKEELNEILNSTSWKITEPVRVAMRAMIRAAESLNAYKNRLTLALSRINPMRWGRRGIVHEYGDIKNTVAQAVKIARSGNIIQTASEVTNEPKSKKLAETTNGTGAFFDHNFVMNNTYPEHVPFNAYDPVDTEFRLIAFYLPQFHPIPENDEAWGKGFTEWTHVSRAIPQFEGHYQPRLPGELGFYDLRLEHVQKRQIELAKNYGLHGFCYHYYWFNGKKVLDTPLNNLLSNPELDFPFCINWANENWTKQGDGLEDDVILAQHHTPEDDLAFIKDIEPILKDPRYIKINGKPLLMIYRPSLFPQILQTADRWRTYCRDCGIGEIYLICSHAHEHLNPETIGFDAATEFAPNTFKVDDICDQLAFYNPDHQGHIYDYHSAVNYSIAAKAPDYKKFRSLCPGWDNDPKNPGKGVTFHKSSPKSYHNWLEYLLYDTRDKTDNPDEKIVFINAWNEWAHGAVMEPDKRYGYAFLDQTYQCLKKVENGKQEGLK